MQINIEMKRHNNVRPWSKNLSRLAIIFLGQRAEHRQHIGKGISDDIDVIK